MTKVSKMEVVQWQQHPVSKALLLLLQETKEVQVQKILAWGTLQMGREIRDTASVIGFIEGLDFILNSVTSLELGEDEKHESRDSK